LGRVVPSAERPAVIHFPEMDELAYRRVGRWNAENRGPFRFEAALENPSIPPSSSKESFEPAGSAYPRAKL